MSARSWTGLLLAAVVVPHSHDPPAPSPGVGSPADSPGPVAAAPQVSADPGERCHGPPSHPPDEAAERAWTRWGEDLRNRRAKGPEGTDLRVDDLPSLELEWAFAVPRARRMRSQPAVAGEWLYLAGDDGVVRALHAREGCVLWEAHLEHPARSGLVLAGAGGGGDAPLLVLGDAAGHVRALDATTGDLQWSRRMSDHPHAVVSGAPTPHEGLLYVPVSSQESIDPAAGDPHYECCTFRGKVVALEANGGEVVWEYLTIDDPPEEQGVNQVGTPRWGPSGAAVWSGVTVDTARGRLYVGTGNNYSRPWTATSSAIHAVDLETGGREWVFQATRADAWNVACEPAAPSRGLARANCPEDHGPDFDFGAAPVLVPVGEGDDVLVAGQKSGVVYGLDPDREGEVLWETRVGRGGLKGGVHFGMSAHEGLVVAPVSDRYDGVEYPHEPNPGLVALEAATGEVRWSTPGLGWVCETRPGCFPGFSAPATALPGGVLAGALDGFLQAFSVEDGERLWRFDTTRRFETVGRAPGHGGAMSAAGPVVAGDMVYVVSGYEGFAGAMPGNVLLAFSAGE